MVQCRHVQNVLFPTETQYLFFFPLPYVMKEFSGGGKNDRERFFSYKLSSSRIVIENAFGRLKGRFGCLKRAVDIGINVLPQVIVACFTLHNYCEMNKEQVTEQNKLSIKS